MGSKKDLILIDSNVFVIDLRYRRDINYNQNRSFLDFVSKSQTGFTTTVNLLEICGILSFNLAEKQLVDLWIYFQERYGVTVLPPPDLTAYLPALPLVCLFDHIKKKISFGDALFLSVAKQHLPFVSKLVTWDKDHFRGKFDGQVIAPDEFLSQR